MGRLWAQQAIEALEVFPEENHEQILSLGRQFGIVTSSSSLLVLETLAQHLEHDIEPHPSRTKLMADFDNHRRQQSSSEESRFCFGGSLSLSPSLSLYISLLFLIIARSTLF